MTHDDWVAKRIAETEEELRRFEDAIAKHGLRVFEREQGKAERDVTDEQRRRLQTIIDDYRRLRRRISP